MITLGIQLKILADTIEYDHLIIDRITDSRQNSPDKRLIYLQRERSPPVAQRVRADNQESIDTQGDGSANTERNIAETQQNI